MAVISVIILDIINSTCRCLLLLSLYFYLSFRISSSKEMLILFQKYYNFQNWYQLSQFILLKMSLSNSNLMTIPVQSPREESSVKKISIIEKQLNIQCCQHDSLMPLLDLHSYQSSMYRWQNNLKIINKKLSQYEIKINTLSQLEPKQTIHQYYHTQEMKVTTIQKIRKNIEELKSNFSQKQSQNSDEYPVSPQMKILKSLYNTNTKTNTIENSKVKEETYQIENLQAESSQSIKQLRRYVEMSLALFRNELMISQMSSQKHSSSGTLALFSNENEEITQKITKHTFHELRKQIQVTRNGLKDYDLKDFHEQSMNRLSSDLVQINEILQILYPQKFSQSTTNKEIEQKRVQLKILEQRAELIDWQIRGLKKKYYCEMNKLYQIEKQSYQTNVLEKTVAKDLKALYQAYAQVKFKIDFIKRMQGLENQK